MPGHFISYSASDAQEFAFRLRDALEAGPPSFPVWLDKRDIKPGQNWGEAINQAIRDCPSFLYVMTRDSVEPTSGCTNEWNCALRYKKPIVPLRLHPDAEMPFGLGPRQHIDFINAQESEEEFNAALARLRLHLAWLASPAGGLQSLKDHLADARRELRRAHGPQQRVLLEGEIARLKQEIASQEAALRSQTGSTQAPPAPPKPRSKAPVLIVVVASLVLYTAIIVAVLRRAPVESEISLPPKEKVPEPRMAPIPGGSFLMGSPITEVGRKEDEWQCEVVVEPFFIGEHEVTQAQWEAVMSYNPSVYKDPNHPVGNVSWEEAKKYCERLSQIFQKPYRLPNEAEWEYAARGNAAEPAPFAFGATLPQDGANFADKKGKSKYGQQTTPVKYFNWKNGFGLYDMHGNVYEWVADDYPRKSSLDCLPRSRVRESNVRVLRGGSWASRDVDCRSANRFGIERPQGPDNPLGHAEPRSRHDYGFRVAMSAER